MQERLAYVYLLTCADQSLYCGWTFDIAKRLEAHNRGTASRYTRSRLPVRLAYFETVQNKKQAMKREYQIKRLNRQQKLLLIANK